MREIAYIAVEIGLCMQIDQISSCCWGKNEIKVNLCSSTPNGRLSVVLEPSTRTLLDIRVPVPGHSPPTAGTVHIFPK